MESLNNDAWDSKIFLVSILLSSVFIYNTKSALANDALTKLSTIAEAGNQVKLKSNLTSVSLNQVTIRESPDFLWVVRDFALEETLPADEQLVVVVRVF